MFITFLMAEEAKNVNLTWTEILKPYLMLTDMRTDCTNRLRTLPYCCIVPIAPVLLSTEFLRYFPGCTNKTFETSNSETG